MGLRCAQEVPDRSRFCWELRSSDADVRGMENVNQLDLLCDEWLMSLQVDDIPFLHLYGRDELCAPPDLDA